jgi:hypothetical protein
MTALEHLRDAGLPDYRVVTSRSASDEQKNAARAGTFRVFGREVELVPPVDWNDDPFASRSGMYELHTFQFLDVLVKCHRDGADEAALEQAVRLALDWIGANPQGGPATNEFAWYDMAVGLRAAYLGYVARAAACAGVLGEEDAQTLVASLQEHGSYLADGANYSSGHNHGLFQDEGLILLCGYLPFLDDATAWRELAWRRCADTLRATVQWEEGAHLEHSPAYHLAITHYLRRLLALPGEERHELRELLGRLEETASWLVLPDGTLPELGDTDTARTARWVVEAAADKSGLRFLRRAGFAVVREGESFLIVSAWYHGHGHKHADELSFVLYEAGHRVICDPGRYGYYEDEPARRYVRSTEAHNSLVLDGAQQDWRDAKPYGSGLVAAGVGAGWYAIEGTNPLLAGAEHRRSFLFKPGSVLVVVDEVWAEAPHEHLRLLHFGPDLDVSLADRGLALSANGFRGAVSDWSDLAVRRSLVRGQEEPSLRGWVFPRDREWVPTWTAELRTAGPTLLAAMAISLQDEELQVREISRDGASLLVELSHATVVVDRGAGEHLTLEVTG